MGMAQNAVEVWPDGTAVSEWFKNTQKVDVGSLGKKYVITDYGVEKAFVFSNERTVKQNGKIIYLPVYYVMFLESKGARHHN